MSISYYEQDEENRDNRLVCPNCGSDVLISEFGELGMCQECFESWSISDLHTRVPILTQVNQENTLIAIKNIMVGVCPSYEEGQCNESCDGDPGWDNCLTRKILSILNGDKRSV